MKNNILRYLNIALLSFSLSFSLTSCNPDNDAFITATEDDYPRILLPDFAEWTDGVPGTYKTLSRTTPLVDSVTVTPALYTTVKWYIDDEEVQEGLHINKTLIAGTYTLKIVATTTKGKSTSRTGMLIINPVDGDPSLANDAKSRWFVPGEKKTVEGENIKDVTGIYVGGVKASDFVNNGTSLTFTVPQVELGYQKIVVETADMQYGCGDANVTDQEWVEPGVEKVSLWEGSLDINWGESNIALNCAELGITTGMTIYIDYDLCDMPDNYHCARLATGPSWLGDVLPQFDLPSDASGTFSVTITQKEMDAINADGGQILVVGYGYNVKRVYYERQTAGAETTIWEGALDINWGESNVALNCADLGIEVGKTVTVYYDLCDMPEGYHCARLATGPSWMGDVLPQFDLPSDASGSFSVNITQTEMDAINADGGQILVVGYGYNAKKVTLK